MYLTDLYANTTNFVIFKDNDMVKLLHIMLLVGKKKLYYLLRLSWENPQPRHYQRLSYKIRL